MSSSIADELPRAQAALYGALAGGGDVTITALYEALLGGAAKARNLNCGVQQYLGPYISKLNRRLKPHRLAVKPGVARASYRLVSL